jgi:signal transduction histidine kinase
LPEQLYAALSRVALVLREQRGGELLTAAMREACALADARLAVLRLPGGSGEFAEFRVPPGSAWPSQRLVNGWHSRVLRTAKPFRIAAGDLPPRTRVSSGIVVPVFTATGALGSLTAFSPLRDAFGVGQCAALSLVVQGAVSRVEGIRSHRQSHALTVAEINERLARDLHDGPLQELMAMLLLLRTTPAAKADPREVRAGLARELRQAVGQMRALINRLRVPPQGTILEDRVRGALTRLQDLRGVSCTLQWEAPPGLLSPVAADEVFHVVNEALANVYRHSRARRVNLVARLRGRALEVTVGDDGVGFDVAQALRRDIRSLSFGIVSMRERMAEVSGTLEIRSQAGKGTRVRLVVPLDRAASKRTA